MKHRYVLKLLVPCCCFLVALGIVVYQHTQNSNEKLLRGSNLNQIVVELFTSQGCKKCPEADAIITKLSKEPKIISLSYHVDYWDDLGWKDRYAVHEYGDYQRRYSRKFNGNSYTPEIIVNGKEHFRGFANRVLNGHLRSESSIVSLPAAQVTRANGNVLMNYKLKNLVPGAQLYALLVLESDEVTITQGENKGEKLTYSNVVLTKVPLDMTLNEGTHTFKLPPYIHKNHRLKVVLLAQDKSMVIKAVSVSKNC